MKLSCVWTTFNHGELVKLNKYKKKEVIVFYLSLLKLKLTPALCDFSDFAAASISLLLAATFEGVSF